jgi:dynein heavy chain 1
VTDVTSDGTKVWDDTCYDYKRIIEKTESDIIATMDQKLRDAKTSEEMFRVFGKLNKLFYRPRINNSVQSFRNDLIENVKKDIDTLRGKHKADYVSSQVSVMCSVRGIPKLSGQVMWASQLERKLDEQTSKIVTVLGPGWAKSPEGRALKDDVVQFKKLLDAKQLKKEYVDNIQELNKSQELRLDGALFDVQGKSDKSPLRLAVAFSPKLFEIYNDIRNLEWAKWAIPDTIKKVAKDKEAMYPIAMSLESSLKIYNNVTSNPEILLLVANYKNIVRSKIMEGTNKKKWPVDREQEAEVKEFAQSFADAVEEYQKKNDDVHELLRQIQNNFTLLETCDYSHFIVAGRISEIQTIMDKMSTKGLVNLDKYAETANVRLQETLASRLTEALQMWLEHGDAAVPSVRSSSKGRFHFELKLRNSDQICLEPPLQDARIACVSLLNDIIEAMVDHPCLVRDVTQNRTMLDMAHGASSSRLGAASRVGDKVIDLVDPDILRDAITTIQIVMDDAQAYVEEWLSRQALWDFNSKSAKERLGDDLDRWMQLLDEVQNERKKFNSRDESMAFGPITISHREVYDEVKKRFKDVREELLELFVDLIHAGMFILDKSLSENVSGFAPPTFYHPHPHSIVLRHNMIVAFSHPNDPPRHRSLPWKK